MPADTVGSIGINPSGIHIFRYYHEFNGSSFFEFNTEESLLFAIRLSLFVFWKLLLAPLLFNEWLKAKSE
jgi:hypothetical protein